jgi:hypothetical protein
MIGRKNPTLRIRLDSSSMIPRAATDFPLRGSTAAMYKLCDMKPPQFQELVIVCRQYPNSIAWVNIGPARKPRIPTAHVFSIAFDATRFGVDTGGRNL